MKTKAFFLAALFTSILAGCGGHDHGPSIIVQDIVSDGGTNDGQITLAGGTYSVVTSNQFDTIFVNFDTASETRGFFTFSLATIPVTASIQRATIFIPILRAKPVLGVASVALLPDMVSFPPLDTLTTQPAMAGVFDAFAILQGPSFEVFPGDAGFDRTFDATNAVVEANFRAFASLQIRLISAGGEVLIDDLFVPPGAGTPLLRVEYL